MARGHCTGLEVLYSLRALTLHGRVLTQGSSVAEPFGSTHSGSGSDSDKPAEIGYVRR